MGLLEPELMCFGDGVQRTKLSSAPVRQFVTRDQVQGRRAPVTAIPRVGQFATSSHQGRSWRRDLDAWSHRHSDLLAAAVAAVGFLCRAWLAHATFFNPDEAWHFSVANQDSIFLEISGNVRSHAAVTVRHCGCSPLLALLQVAESHSGSDGGLDQALQFIRRQVSPADVIYVNRPTEF